jgi:hypothetical protein
MILLAAAVNFAAAAPVTYSFSTGTVVSGGPSTAGGPAPALNLFGSTGVSGTFVYDSEAQFATLAPDGSVYRGFTPQSVTGFATSLSDLSGSVGGHAFADVSGSTLVGNDTFGSALPEVDIVQFLFDPPLSSTLPHNLTGLDLEGFDLINIRMFWIEGHPDADPPIPDFLTDQSLPATPPSFHGRLAFDFIQTGNPAATSFIFFDELSIQPLAIPEPQTYALMLAAFGLLGFAFRCKPKARLK